MEQIVYGSLRDEGMEVIRRDDRYFVRYDAGAHMTAWREDEISVQELARLKMGRNEEYRVLLEIQNRVQPAGGNPYSQNWTPLYR